MSNSNAIRNAVRLALCSGALATAAGYAPMASAQQSDEPANMEEIVVTGSRIVRRDFDSASPIQTVDSELIEQVGSVTIESTLNTLPQFVPSITSSSNNPSNGGQANVELRGLGTTRTLILIDGRRVMPSNATGVVDLNIIPASLIENIEVITGGASAVYGSDAIGGVVNFKLKRFTGVEVTGGWGQTSESDGAQYSISAAGGMEFAGGRGHIMGDISYVDREIVFHGDRAFSEFALGYNATTGEFNPSGSATIPQGRFDTTTSNLPDQAVIDQVFGGYGVGAGEVGQGSNFGFNEDGTIFSIAPALNFTGDPELLTNPASFNYNFAPVNALQLPLDRTSFFLRGDYEINENVTFYGQALYTDYEVYSQLAASPATSLNVPVTNPNIPADLSTILASRADPTADFRFRRRMLESGPRSRALEYTVQQYTLGFQGDLVGEWSFDTFGSYGKIETTETQGGNLSRSAYQELLEAPDGGVALCGGFNPFGINQITEECASFLAVDAVNTRGGNRANLEANFQGPIASLPAGDMILAVGSAYLRDTFFEDYDAVLRTGDVIGFNANDNIDASTDVIELYGEVLIPIANDRPGIYNLETTLGYRLSKYSTAGTVESYKAEAIYAPIESLSFRGTYQRAVRAPNISELFSPITENFPGIDEDPCSNDSDARAGSDAAQVEALCVAQGIPAAALPVYNYANQQVAGGLTGGNPDLNEETADTFSVGVVVQSPFDNAFWSGFSASVDYYQIEIEDAISSIDAQTFVANCYDAQFNPNFEADNTFCNFFRRDPQTSEIIDASELLENLAFFESAGIDIQIDWAGDIGPGSLSAAWIATNLQTWDRVAFEGAPTDELAGTIGNRSIGIGVSRPDWKWTFNTDYLVGNWGFNLRWRYIDSMVDNNVEDFETDALSYLDLGMTYDFKDLFGGSLEGLTGRISATNVTDQDPEIIPARVQANTDPSAYDTLGRRFYVSLKYTFE